MATNMRERIFNGDTLYPYNIHINVENLLKAR